MNGIEQSEAEISRVRREGFAWVELLTSGEATDADAEALKLWRTRSPTHAQSLREAMRLKRATEQLAREARAGRSVGSRLSGLGLSRRALLGGAGAVAGGAAASGLLMLHPPGGLWPSLAELTADDRTGVGERRNLDLASGVKADLNTRTSIGRRDTASGPGVELVSGEALVDTSALPSGTFFVQAGQGRTTATGAARFNIRYEGAEACVTCVNGEVRVQQGGDEVRLRPNDQLVYARDGFKPVRVVDPEVATAWRRGYLIFRDTPLEEVVAELNRYRSGRIMLANRALAQRPVYGVFRIDRPDTAIAQIRKLAGAHTTTLPGGVLLMT